MSEEQTTAAEEQKKAAMLELAARFKRKEIDQRDITLAAYLGHQPALDFLELTGKSLQESSANLDEWLEGLQEIRERDETPVRVMIASSNARITVQEQNNQKMAKWWRGTLNALEDHILINSGDLRRPSKKLIELGETLYEYVGMTAQMMADGDLSISIQENLVIALELEKILKLFDLQHEVDEDYEGSHSLELSLPDLQSVRAEFLPWLLDGKDPIRDRAEARRIQSGQNETRGNVVEGLQD